MPIMRSSTSTTCANTCGCELKSAALNCSSVATTSSGAFSYVAKSLIRRKISATSPGFASRMLIAISLKTYESQTRISWAI